MNSKSIFLLIKESKNHTIKCTYLAITFPDDRCARKIYQSALLTVFATKSTPTTIPGLNDNAGVLASNAVRCH